MYIMWWRKLGKIGLQLVTTAPLIGILSVVNRQARGYLNN